jgi:hypothetical protein
MPPARTPARTTALAASRPWVRACALVAVLVLLVPAAVVDEYEKTWREFRLPPFEVIAERDTRELRTFLGDLFQYHYLLSRLIPGEEPQAQWPIRIWVPRQAAAPEVVQGDRLPLVVDRYLAVMPGNPQLTPALKAAIARTVIHDSLRPMPEWFEEGLISMLAGVRIDGQVMQLGPLPAGQEPDLNWAQVYWLLSEKESVAMLAALAGNLEKGIEEQIAMRNSYRVTPEELRAEARKVMASGSFPPLKLGGLANNPRRDFRDWYVPLGYSNLAAISAHAVQPDLAGLAQAIASVRRDYETLDVKAVSQVQAMDAYVALRDGEVEDAAKILGELTELGNTRSAWVYLEAAKLARSKAEKQRLAGYAVDMNPGWPEVHRFLAELEDDPVVRGNLLLEAASHAPRSQELWEQAATSFMDGREYALADKALESAAVAARDDAERQRLRDARWEMREVRAEKEEEDRQKRIAAERRVIEDLKAKTMSRIEEALERANRENESPEQIEEEIVNFGDLDDDQSAEGALVRVVCRSDGQYLLEIKTVEGYTRLLLKSPDAITTEDGEPWEFRCGAQPNPQVVRATFRPAVNNRFGTIGEVLSLSLP